jgi:hypothetical protein
VDDEGRVEVPVVEMILLASPLTPTLSRKREREQCVVGELTSATHLAWPPLSLPGEGWGEGLRK